MRSPDLLRKPLLAAVLASICFGSPSLVADGEYLVQDLGQARTPSLAPGELVEDSAVLDGVAYFFEDDGRHGYELWRSDGSETGTYLLRDACPGVCGSESFFNFGIERVDTFVYFSANDGVHGSELWVTDGTAAGTRLVADVVPGPGSSDPTALAGGAGRVYFQAGAWFDRRIWVSDGTLKGTRPLFDPLIDPLGAGYWSLAFIDGILLARESGSPGPLWRTDGTIAGTFVVHPFIGFPAGFGYAGSHVVLDDGALIFQGCAADNQSDCELWRTDGTLAGTFALGDLNPGVASSWPGGFVRVGLEAWFSAWAPGGPFGERPVLFRTDGTAAGTALLPAPVDLEMRSSYSHAASLDDGLVFVGCDGTSGCEPWFTDGSSTTMIADLLPGSDSSVQMMGPFDRPRMTSVGSTVLFIATSSGGGAQLWRTDGTSKGTFSVSDFDDLPSDASFGWYSALAPSMVAAGRWVLPVLRNDRGVDVWSSDGTLPGATRIATIAAEAHSMVHPLRSFSTPGRSECAAPLRQGMTAKVLNLELPGTAHLAFSDGVPGGVERLGLLDEVNAGVGVECSANGQEVLASTRAASGDGYEIWRTRGVAGSTEPIFSAAPLASSPAFERHRDELAFASTEGLFLVPRGANSEAIRQLPSVLGWGQLVSGDELLFRTDGSGGLEVTDGLADPELLLAAAPDGREITDAAWAGGLLFFAYDTPEEGAELWRSDGTVQGTGSARNLVLGPTGGIERRSVLSDLWNRPLEVRIASFAPGRVVFPGNDGTTGFELWRSDGTEAGTVVVADIAPGPDGSWPRHLVSLGNSLVLFAAEHPTFGYELFRTDGTAAGTAVVRDLVTGVGSSVPDDFVVQDGVLYFSAWTREHGREAWRSDGTAAGTYRLTEVAPGPLSSSPSRFVRRGNRLFFTATDHVHGFELWARADDGSVPLFIDGFETGDTARWSQATK
jgi:ELWxxDGT repeat protein